MNDDIVSDVVIKNFMLMVMTKKIWWKGENDENDRDNDQDFNDDDYDDNNNNADNDNDVDNCDDDDDNNYNVRCNDLWIIQCQKKYSTEKKFFSKGSFLQTRGIHFHHSLDNFISSIISAVSFVRLPFCITVIEEVI